MKNRTARLLITIAMALCVSHAPCVADEAPMLPQAVNQMIEEALQVRKDALQYKEMRHHENIMGEGMRFGVSGKKFRGIMDRIAEFPMDEKLIKRAQQLQDRDIRFKMIVWALDRKQRQGEYDRFSKWYLNVPIPFEERIEHFMRGNPDYKGIHPVKERVGNIRIIYPIPVASQDIIEENRPIFEFTCYAPPDGLQFQDFSARSILMQALSSMGKHEKTFVVWKSDLDMVLDIPIKEGEDAEGVDANTRHAISAIMHIGTKEAFSVLGAKWPQDRARQAIDLLFKNSWSASHLDFNEVTYAAAKKHYETWMALANADWETPGEKAFAEWLKQQTPPKAPPPPQYTDDPNDPFSLVRPSSKSE
jgi:hypothetical protein